MNIYISVVSHGHDKIINDLGCLKSLSNDFNIIIKSNKNGDDFNELKTYKNIHWINSDYGLGFGCNNNVIFEYCINYLGMKDDDLFIVFNPDLSMDINSIYELARSMKRDRKKLCCINLFRDSKFSVFDNSVRNFPVLVDFIKSFIGLNNGSIINKKNIYEAQYVDWAAGSFLAFNTKHYQDINGFDESYFMYCEDIDICFRSNKEGIPVYYYPEIKALHYAKHENRNIFSKHLYWHVKSVFRFISVYHGRSKQKSRLNKNTSV